MSDRDSLLEAGQRNFRREHEADWRELEALLSKIERRSVTALSVDEAMRLPVLYRSALSSLSIARATSLDRALIAYLEPLCTRAYLIVYGVRTRAIDGVLGFFRTSWPGAVRTLWRETLVAVLLLVIGTLVGYFLVQNDPVWFRSFLPDSLGQGRSPSSSTAELSKFIYSGADVKGGWLSLFATTLFMHNSQVSIMCFALGFALGVPTAYLVVQNGLIIGALLAIYAEHGLTWNLVGWLMIHGTTELFAIVLAGAAGFRIGLATAFPGPRRRLAAASDAGRTAATVMIGVVLMLFFAGVLEGVGRQLIQSDVARYAIGTAMLLLWLGYFYLPRREVSDGR